MLKKLRIIFATIFIIGLTLLFLDFSGIASRWLGWMAKIQFWPAVLALNFGVIVGLLALTLLFGRVYCSVICPLGVFQDAVAGLRRKKNRYHYRKGLTVVRGAVFVLFVTAFLCGGASIAALIAPYSAFGRMVQTLLQPLWMWCNNLLASIAEHYDSYAFYGVDVWVRSLPVLIVGAVTFVVIGLSAWFGGRIWCNSVCPVGSLLGFFSKFSLFKFRIDEDKCVSCGLCAKNCKSSCIDPVNHKIDYSRCVDCFDCIEHCHTDAISYTARRAKRGETTGKDKTDTGRREFVGAMTALAAGSLVAQAQKKVDGGLAVIEEKKRPARATRIVPPGAVSLKNMESNCTGCQLCVSKCPNDVLRPSTDPLHFLQPESDYERGWCRPECAACSNVCPTGAIRPLSPAEKSATHIGYAVWVPANCIVLTDGVECGNCARHCPTGSILMVPSPQADGRKVPAVNTATCIGCGACENLCPARPFSAIYVEGIETHRIS